MVEERVTITRGHYRTEVFIPDGLFESKHVSCLLL